MAQEAAAERGYLTSQADWDKVSGPEYGGQADILTLNVGEFGGPFEYVGHQPMTMEGGKNVTVHIGLDPLGETVRLPIAASFLRAIDQAEVRKGDKFLIRRDEDVAKKAGVGKGTKMGIYALKITFKAPVQQQQVPAGQVAV